MRTTPSPSRPWSRTNDARLSCVPGERTEFENKPAKSFTPDWLRRVDDFIRRVLLDDVARSGQHLVEHASAYRRLRRWIGSATEGEAMARFTGKRILITGAASGI